MSDKNRPPLFRQKLELLILTQSDEVLNRAKRVVSNHHFTFRHLSFEQATVGTLGELLKAQLILLAQDSEESLSDFAHRVDFVLGLFPRSRVVTVMGPSFSRENLEGSQNPRVTPLSRVEFFSTLKFEYLCLYRCRSSFFEIQASDLFPMTTMPFPASIRLSLNQRYLAVVHSNTTLSDERYSRLKSSEGLYIKIKDSEKYLQYINSYYDSSGKGLKKRARAYFLTVYYYSLYLNESVLFDFKSSTDEHVAEVYGKIKTIAADFFKTLSSDEDLWDVIRESLDGDLNLYWRAPWIATYGALISLKSNQGDPLIAFLAGLLADVGLYDLEENLTQRFLLNDDKASVESLAGFKKHPILSLNRCLIKKIPLEEAVKSVLVCTHEQANEKGFPNQVPADKLPVEAQILLLAEKIDQGVLTTMKQTGVGFRFLKEKIWEKENTAPGNFSPEFLAHIAESLL